MQNTNGTTKVKGHPHRKVSALVWCQHYEELPLHKTKPGHSSEERRSFFLPDLYFLEPGPFTKPLKINYSNYDYRIIKKKKGKEHQECLTRETYSHLPIREASELCFQRTGQQIEEDPSRRHKMSHPSAILCCLCSTPAEIYTAFWLSL